MKLKIEIVTPAPLGSLHGNRMTALRWQKILTLLNHQCTLAQEWTSKPCDVLVALHGLRSFESIQRFKHAHPTRPLVLIMTGTDIYRDLKNSEKVHRSMDLADAIVVLQAAAVSSLPKKHHPKVQVIYQSIKGVSRKPPPQRHFLVSVIGHLRAEKDPFCAAQSMSMLPLKSKIQLVHLGAAMSPEFETQARLTEKNEPRYRWLGELSHAKTMQWLSRSHLMVISSLMEGGAHVVSEAIAIGVPVIASDIAGNRGLLGDAYPAYFPVGDPAALSQLLTRAETDPIFYKKMSRAVRKQSAFIKPEREQKSIKKLLQSLLTQAPQDLI